MIEIKTVGGFSEVGKNMTAIRYKNEVVICDLGFHLPAVVKYEEEEGERFDLTKEEMIDMGMIPDDEYISDWKPFVKAIVCSHCHLDHIGAVPYLAPDLKVPVYGTDYTIEVIKTILKDERIKIPNQLINLKPRKIVKISENLKIELVHTTHSTPQTAFVVIHTPEGVIVYANDFKLDDRPTLGKKPDYRRLEELQKEGVICLIMDSLYAHEDSKTPSENVAKEMLKDVMNYVDGDNVIIVTSFASQIARLKSIVQFGKKLNRRLVFLGRSMHKYISAAENVGIINFRKDIELIRFGDKARRKLKQIERNRDKYIIVCTGSQGEPNAILTRMAKHELPFKFKRNDVVIFSCKTIPSESNIENREFLENKLKERNVRIFKDVHVSGHGAIEDYRQLITLLKPKHLIPSHGPHETVAPVIVLAKELGFKDKKTFHFMEDGKSLKI